MSSGAGAGAGSRKKIPRAGAAPKQSGSETLLSIMLSTLNILLEIQYLNPAQS